MAKLSAGWRVLHALWLPTLISIYALAIGQPSLGSYLKITKKLVLDPHSLAPQPQPPPRIHTPQILAFSPRHWLVAWREEWLKGWDTGSIRFCYTRDGGVSWSQMGTIAAANAQTTFNNPVLACAAHSHPVLLVTRCQGDGEHGDFGRELWAFSSSDQGQKWNSKPIKNLFNHTLFLGGPPLQTKAGEYLLAYTDRTSTPRVVGVLESEDLLIWKKRSEFKDTKHWIVSEGHLIRDPLNADSLWCVLRTNQKTGSTCVAVSRDEARTWKPPALAPELPSFNSKSLTLSLAATSDDHPSKISPAIHIYNSMPGRKSLSFKVYEKAAVGRSRWTQESAFFNPGSSNYYPNCSLDPHGGMRCVHVADQKLAFTTLDLSPP